MIKAGQQRRFEMESTQEEKLNSVDVSLSPLTEQIIHREDIRRSHAWTKGYLVPSSRRESQAG
jgi:Ni/Co efflux regulator RcnB